jgi:metal-responsive CopG/Arc/MetJ family transcriptional regulator
MGRPPLMMLRTHISFPPETLNRIDKIVGEKGRAAFIRKAVDQLLDSVELTKKLEAEQAKRSE